MRLFLGGPVLLPPCQWCHENSRCGCQTEKEVQSHNGQASSGKTVRHRLNRGGNRAANNTLWTIAMVRMRSVLRTQVYVARRTAEGKSVKESHRCLKRYIVRELYPIILADLKESALLT